MAQARSRSARVVRGPRGVRFPDCEQKRQPQTALRLPALARLEKEGALASSSAGVGRVGRVGLADAKREAGPWVSERAAAAKQRGDVGGLPSLGPLGKGRRAGAGFGVSKRTGPLEQRQRRRDARGECHAGHGHALFTGLTVGPVRELRRPARVVGGAQEVATRRALALAGLGAARDVPRRAFAASPPMRQHQRLHVLWRVGAEGQLLRHPGASREAEGVDDVRPAPALRLGKQAQRRRARGTAVRLEMQRSVATEHGLDVCRGEEDEGQRVPRGRKAGVLKLDAHALNALERVLQRHVHAESAVANAVRDGLQHRAARPAVQKVRESLAGRHFEKGRGRVSVRPGEAQQLSVRRQYRAGGEAREYSGFHRERHQPSGSVALA